MHQISQTQAQSSDGHKPAARGVVEMGSCYSKESAIMHKPLFYFSGLTFIIFLLFLIHLNWVGYLSSDDVAYFRTALSYLEDGEFVANSHWAVRHPLILSNTATLSLMDDYQLAIVLPDIIYLISLYIILGFWLYQRFSFQVFVLFSLLFVTSPALVFVGTYCNIDIVEAFFLVSSLVLFLEARLQNRTILYLLAGALSGLAFLSRETAISLVIFYGLFFFLFDRQRFRCYCVLGLGALLPLLFEAGYYWIAVGNPLHRYEVVLATAGTVDPVATGTGNLIDHYVFGPIAALLLNNEFGFLFWLFTLALAGYKLKNNKLASDKDYLYPLLFFCGVFFVVVDYGLRLRPLPRYQTSLAVVSMVIIAILLVQLRYRVWSLVLVVLVMIGSNVLLLDLSNKQPRLAEYSAWRILSEQPDVKLYTDCRTYERAKRLLELHQQTGLVSRFSCMRPTVGGLLLYDTVNANYDYVYHLKVDSPIKARPKDWERIEIITGKPTYLGQILSRFGVSEQDLPRRVFFANHSIEVFKVS